MNPYIVSMSTNGRYYDYTGIYKEERDEVYDKIEAMSRSANFDFINFKEREYEPYFYIDGKHLGWKGWLYTNDKNIDNSTDWEKIEIAH